MAAAAHELGISETTVRQHLSGLYRRTGCLNAAQAAYLLGTGVFRRVPGQRDQDVVSLAGERPLASLPSLHSGTP